MLVVLYIHCKCVQPWGECTTGERHFTSSLFKIVVNSYGQGGEIWGAKYFGELGECIKFQRGGGGGKKSFLYFLSQNALLIFGHALKKGGGVNNTFFVYSISEMLVDIMA